MTGPLDPKTLLILGAHGGGIGSEVAEHVMDDLGTPLKDWYSNYLAPTPEELDLSDLATVFRYVKKHGPFHNIIWSVGVSDLRWIRNIRPRGFNRVMTINTSSLVELMASHEYSFPDHEGRLVVVVSDAADQPMRGSLSYCASKAALAMVVRCFARELHPRWTTVAVSPGVVGDTPMTENLDEELKQFRGWNSHQIKEYKTNAASPLGRRVQKSEVAEAIVFALTGPKALNGSNIIINGGK